MLEDLSKKSLKQGAEAFREHVERESDPVKQRKLKEFLPYIDKSLDIYELGWFWVKAVQSAEATRALLDREEEARRHRKAQRALWKKRLIIAWFIFIITSGVLLSRAFGPVYIYTTRDGMELASDTYEGKTVISGEERIPLAFVREKIAMRGDGEQQIIIIVISSLILGAVSVVKIGVAV